MHVSGTYHDLLTFFPKLSVPTPAVYCGLTLLAAFRIFTCMRFHLLGCKHIQLDEPLFLRKVKETLDYGIDHASKCIEDLGDEVTKTIHICCGYPSYLVSHAHTHTYQIHYQVNEI